MTESNEIQRASPPAWRIYEPPAADPQKALWLAIRRALLMVLDALEVFLGITPRTSEIRRAYKNNP